MLKLIIPRILIFALLVAIVIFARHGIVQWSIVSYAKSRWDVKVEMDSTQFEPTQGKLLLKNVRIPDPVNPRSEFATVDSVNVEFSIDDFLKRSYTIERAEFRGVHYKTTPAESRIFVPKDLWGRFKVQFPQWFAARPEEDWVSVFSGNIDRRTLDLLENRFQSSKYSQELSAKWKTEFEDSHAQVRGLQKRVERIQKLLENKEKIAKEGAVETIAAVLDDARSLERDLRVISEKIASLESAARKDAVELKQKLRDDFEQIKALSPPKIDPQLITDVLIGSEVQDRFASLFAWFESVHTLVNTPVDERSLFQLSALKGENVVFESRKNRSDFLLKTLLFDGDAFFDEKPIYFLGSIRDVSFPSEKWNEAIGVQLCLDSAPLSPSVWESSPLGSTPSESFALNRSHFNEPLGSESLREKLRTMSSGASNAPSFGPDSDSDSNRIPRVYVSAILDRRADPPREKYYIACPRYVLPQRTLGNVDKFAFGVSPGMSQLYAEVNRDGDNVFGRVRISQFPVRLTPIIPEKYRNSSSEALFSGLSEGIELIDAEMVLQGTMSNPQIQLHSDLGRRLVSRMESVLAQLWNQSRQNVADELSDKTNQTLSLLGNTFREQLNPVLSELNAAQSRLVGGDRNASVEQMLRSLADTISEGDEAAIKEQLRNQGKQMFDSTFESTIRGALEGANQGNFEEGLKKGFLEGLDRFRNP